MSNKPKKLFYVRIDFIDLLDFATDPVGKKMSLLGFAKELARGKSDIPQIQRIINEAHCYLDQKKRAGKESAERRKAERERIKAEATVLNGPPTEVNGVATVLNGPPTEVNEPPTNNSNSSNKLHAIQEKATSIFTRSMEIEGKIVDVDTGEIVYQEDMPF